MARSSIRERINRLKQELISSDLLVDALLEVRSHLGEVLFTVGGLWHSSLRRYVTPPPDRPVKPLVVVLQESQLEIGRAAARILAAWRAGDMERAHLLIAQGNRGGGKTWFLGGLFLVVVALEFPREWQLAVTLTTKQRKECLGFIRACSRPSWITLDGNDPRDVRTVFLTGHTIGWLTAGNPKSIRQAGLPIRNVLLNEAQDEPESVFVNAVSAIRNTGGVLTITTNPPQHESGNWVAHLCAAKVAKEIQKAEVYFLEAKLNRAIEQETLPVIAGYLRAVSSTAEEADAQGLMHIAGRRAYPAFLAAPYNLADPAEGGHIAAFSDLPQIGWTDVTRELTALAINDPGGVGFEYVVGVDFQRRPGIVGAVAKLFRDATGRVVLWIYDYLPCPGVEDSFSQALFSAGYTTNGFRPDGTTGPAVLLVGDGTSDRQNASHNTAQPPSFHLMRNHGWVIEPPEYHWKTGIPWNPWVRDSRAQMHQVLGGRQILFSPRCKEPAPRFPSLIKSFQQAKVFDSGALVSKGDFQHGPDGVRYLAWKFLPHAQAPTVDPTLDVETFDTLANLRVGF